MRECTWRKFKRSQLDLPVDTALARILHVDTEQTLLQGIVDETLFGFLCCDVETPIEKIKEYQAGGFLFPPVISRMELSDEHLSPYMRERYLEEHQKPSNTVVQTYCGTQVFAMTAMVNRWLKLGMKVSNITRFVQYVPGKALAPFVNKVTQGRIEATYEKDEAKSNTYKLFGNSGKTIINRLYGKYGIF